MRDALDIVGASNVLEIGSDQGYQTRLLLDWCEAKDATAHIIDPFPKYDVDEWSARWGSRFVLYRDLSLKVLPEFEVVPDVALIDGDHNWYTVLGELRALEQLAGGDTFPIVLMHDVGWPYGRRDLYYNPAVIPERERQSARRAGIVMGSPTLDENRGLNPHLHNAEVEGGPRNGVLTAIEDFVSESDQSLRWGVIPAIHGLGIIVDTRRLGDPALEEWFEELTSPTKRVMGIIETTEKDRIAVLTRAAERSRAAVFDLASDPRFHYLDERLSSSEQAVRSLRKQLDGALDSLRLERERRRMLERRLAKEKRRAKKLRRNLASLQQRKLVRLARKASTIRQRLGRFRRVTRDLRSPDTSSSHQTRLLQASSTAEVGSLNGNPSPAAQSQADTNDRQVQSRPAHAEDRGGSADIVVCVHNAPDDARLCLESVIRHSDLSRHRLIVVDDGSEAPAAAVIDKIASEVEVSLVRNEEAKGYTKAANQGIRFGTGDFVVLLNSDTIVTPGWLDRLITCATHRSGIAIVGPLSNAASWQSIPLAAGVDGWAVNEAPAGADLDEFATRLAARSFRLYPEVSVVNGFCYLISREAIAVVGELDEELFPRGYGEEDDFSLRCSAAGFSLHIADDCYIYHAKSRSFTPELRRSIVERSKVALNDRHGARVDELHQVMESSATLRRARAYATSLLDNSDEESAAPLPVGGGLRIAWLQPHLQIAGGIRRAIEMGNRLIDLGHEVDLVSPNGTSPGWLETKTTTRRLNDAATRGYDVLIVSDPDVIGHADRIPATHRVIFHLAGYAVYRHEDRKLDRFYFQPNALHVANSTWTADVARARNPDIEIASIIPGGVDLSLFRPHPVEPDHDIVFHGSHRPHKGTGLILAAAGARTRLSLAEHDPPQEELARLISRGRVFASAAWHEGFNLSCIEAMACGVPVVMTDDGGSRDYAANERNALVVPRGNMGELSRAITRVLNDGALAHSLVTEGFKTAQRHDWNTTTHAFSRILQRIAGAAP